MGLDLFYQTTCVVSTRWAITLSESGHSAFENTLLASLSLYVTLELGMHRDRDRDRNMDRDRDGDGIGIGDGDVVTATYSREAIVNYEWIGHDNHNNGQEYIRCIKFNLSFN